MRFETSDWVQGRTSNGELIQGFIEHIDSLEGIVTVQVIKSDNEDSVGKPTAVREHWIKKIPEDAPMNAQQLLSMIDLALATRDEAWFMELTDQLQAVKLLDNYDSRNKNNAKHSRLTSFI
jgi:hypothetical protein